MTDIQSSSDIAKAKRKSERAATTRAINTANDSFTEINDENSFNAESLLLKLRRHQDTLDKLNEQILRTTEFTEADLPAELSKQQEYTDNLTETIDRIDITLRRLKDAAKVTPARAESKSKVKTPKLELTQYEGDPLRWEEFWDDFTCSVDSRTDLSTINKFKLLKQSLKGEALSLADGYFLTQRNYQEVKDALADRFGDPQVAIFAHFEALLELSPASHEVEQLIRIRDKCEAHIRSLTALGLSEDMYGLVFAPILLSKLPRFVKMEMHRRNGSTRWTIANLREHLKEKIRVRTKSDRAFSSNFADGQSSSKPPSKNGKSGSKLPGSGSALFINGGGKGAGKAKGAGSVKQSSGGAHSRLCHFCQGNHSDWDCTKFSTVDARTKQIKGRCYAYLSDKHMKSSCPSNKTCFYCNKSGHHSSLCYSKFGKPSQEDSDPGDPHASSGKPPENSDSANLIQDLNPEAPEFTPQVDFHSAHVSPSGADQKQPGMAVLESALVPVHGSSGSANARIVFDNGSTLSFTRKRFSSLVGGKSVGQSRTKLGRFGDGGRSDCTHSVVQLHVQLRDGTQLVLSLREVENISSPIRLVPVPLDGIVPTFSPDDFAGLVEQPETAEIDILIGLDYYYDIVGPEIWRGPNGVVIKQTAVGKILTGYVREFPRDSATDHQMIIMAGPEVSQDLYDLERLWKIEEAGVVDRNFRSDDQIAVDLFNKSVRLESGRYEVKWPFKEDPPNLPLNYDVSLRRLSSVHRKLNQTPDLFSTCNDIFNDQLSKGVIELAPEEPEGPVHYLPHHAVVIPKRETTKVRLVFDASSKPSSDYHRLNESMYRGPVFLNDLCGLLLRLRGPTYAVTSDVEKAFLQIALHKEHRDCTRFLWLRDVSKPPTPGNLVVYRYTRVLFGATASPFLLAATVIHHMKQANTPTSNTVINSAYMDNIITGFDTTQDLLTYFQAAKSLFSEMSMNLHQWYSNNTQFLSSIPPGERGTREKPSVLGLTWDLATDTIACSVGSMVDGVHSKRTVLQSVATVYDPRGWFSPVTVTGKILLQSLWKAKVGWDDKLSADFSQEWNQIRASMLELPKLPLSRRFSCYGISKSSDWELHVFCDASSKAYCACVYLRLVSTTEYACDLLFAKTRVAPVKQQSIPKLELSSVHLGVQLLTYVASQLQIPVSSQIIWTDSLCAICWIESNKVTTPFVQNRVRKILAVSGLSFRHVPSQDNPADLGSRGTSASALVESRMWWSGPSWLLKPESEWPSRPQGNPIVPQPEDSKQLVTPCDEIAEENVFNLERFSSLQKLLRVTALVKRACLKFRRQSSPSGPITSRELQQSLSFWEVRVQKQHFQPIFDNSADPKWRSFERQLGIFIDDNKVIRSRGRFQFSASLSDKAKFPILLPKSSQFTKLVILHCHSRVLHFGVKHTLAKVREKYWICQGRSTVKSILLKCQVCRIHYGGPFKVPDLAPLPSFRASIKRPFSVVGFDYLGPLYVRDAADITTKVWIALFTCAVTRAVHLELVSSLSAADFLLALRRFVAIYSKPQLIVSDNARQFKAADQLLKKEFKRLSTEAAVADYLAASGIEWKYIVEKAPWMGGFYERLVAVVKEALKKSLGQWTMKTKELQTLCYEIAFVINSRPLIYAEDDPAAHVLTPLDFLFRSTECFADGSGEEMNENLTKADELLMHWRAGQNLLRQFWDSWRNNYLVALRESSRAGTQRDASDILVNVGAVVLIKDNVPRGQWKVAKIVKLRKSHDGLVRAAEVKLASGLVLVRPIKLLYPIEGGIESQDAAQAVSCDAAASQLTSRSRPVSLHNGQASQDRSDSPSKNRPKRKAAETARDLTKQILAGL